MVAAAGIIVCFSPEVARTGDCTGTHQNICTSQWDCEQHGIECDVTGGQRYTAIDIDCENPPAKVAIQIKTGCGQTKVRPPGGSACTQHNGNSCGDYKHSTECRTIPS